MPEKSGLTSGFLARAFGIFSNSCAFCGTGITIGLVVASTDRVVLHGAYTILFRIFSASGFLLATCPEAKEERDDEDDS